MDEEHGRELSILHTKLNQTERECYALEKQLQQQQKLSSTQHAQASKTQQDFSKELTISTENPVPDLRKVERQSGEVTSKFTLHANVHCTSAFMCRFMNISLFCFRVWIIQSLKHSNTKYKPK